jgi:hypothetical protein
LSGTPEAAEVRCHRISGAVTMLVLLGHGEKGGLSRGYRPLTVNDSGGFR